MTVMSSTTVRRIIDDEMVDGTETTVKETMNNKNDEMIGSHKNDEMTDGTETTVEETVNNKSDGMTDGIGTTCNHSSRIDSHISRRTEWLVILVILLLSYLVRSYKIEKGNFVIWDEAHFGKFASKYLQRLFYFDVHPPLGKMLTALSGYLFGQDVSFSFDSGAEYPKQMDYVGMRRFHALISSFVPVFSYLTLREMSFGMHASITVALMVVFENALVCISRLILLDSHLLLFTSMVIYALSRYINGKTHANLLFLGISLGCVQSVKWIGCFTTLLVGLFVIAELWLLLVQKSVPLRHFMAVFMLRALYLIAVPVLIYVLLFIVHFAIVNHSSADDGHMSSFFQSSLKGNEHKHRKYVEYGTVVTIKSAKLSGQYLHSHKDVYPDIEDNQVTTYGHKDENNYWAFQKVVDGQERAEYVKDGDEIVLMHMHTHRYLTMTDRNAYVTKGDKAVSTSPNNELFRGNLFVVEMVSDMVHRESKVKTLTTKFRLRSADWHCYLRSTSARYPQWGFRQGEVTCSERKDGSTLWNIEMNNKVRETDVEYKELASLRSAVFYNIIEHNALMYITNKSFVQDDDLEPIRIVSRAYEWPILRRGLRMCSWNDDSIKFYMFGNPFSWYLSLFCVTMAPAMLLCSTLRRLRNRQRVNVRTLVLGCMFCGGWAIHYLPFFFIGRVLYFHHYLPALYFSMHSILFFFRNTRVLYAILAVHIVVYCMYSPFNYGFYDQNAVRWLKVLPTWDFVDEPGQ